ncbi:MAG: competence/damage-inducible protein A, partial [Ramlibacter sp.]|nr:competence/damage-inducible protein A [Ramlibacter sp.]
MTAPVLPHGIQAPPAHASMPRFHLLLIGDELLSGRRQDKHVPH